MKKIIWIILFAIVGLLMAREFAYAATEVDNLTGGTYEVLIHPTGGDRVADSFTASVNADSVEVTISLKRNGTVGHTGYFKIWADSSGSPGSERCSADITDSDGNTSTYTSVSKTLTGCGLTQGSTYWAGFQDDSNNGSAYYQLQGDNAGSWKGYDSSAWSSNVWTFNGSWNQTSNADLLYKVVTTDSGGTTGSSTATTTVSWVYNESETVYNGFILFFIAFFGILFYFRKGVIK